MDRQFIPQHNVLVNLDVTARGASRVERVLTFLARSRIRYAITESPTLSKSILSQFWENIQYDSSVTPPVLKTRVNNRPVIFSATHLRDILRLGSVEQEDGPLEYPSTFIEGAVHRMGYVEQDPADARIRGRQYHKPRVYGEWRFLWHVIVTIFGSRKGGYDELSPVLMSAVLSLVYNKPYSFSKYIFGELVRQAMGSVKSHFLLYPRFCMLIIRHCIPNLRSVAADLSVDVIGLRGYNAMFLYTARHCITQPEETELFGHIIDPHYVAPPHNDWFDVEDDAMIPADDVPSQSEPQDLIEDVQELSISDRTKQKGKRKMKEFEQEVDKLTVVLRRTAKLNTQKLLIESEPHMMNYEVESPEKSQEEHVLDDLVWQKSEKDELEFAETPSTHDEQVVLRKSERLQWQQVREEAKDPNSKVIISSSENKPTCNPILSEPLQATRRSSRLKSVDTHATHSDVPPEAAESIPASSSKKQKVADKSSPKTLESRVYELEHLAEIYMTDMTVMWNAIEKLATAYSSLLNSKGQVIDHVVSQQRQLDELKEMFESFRKNLPVQGEKMEDEGSSKSKKKQKAKGK